MKTWQMWMVVAGMALAVSGRPARAGTAEAAGRWGASSVVGDNSLWSEPTFDSRPDPVLDALVRGQKQPAMAAKLSETAQSAPPSAGGASDSSGDPSDSIKSGLFIRAASGAGNSAAAPLAHLAAPSAKFPLSAADAAGAVGSSGDPVRAIPAPTALYLFPAGALLAIFAAWRMGRRRAPLLATVRATFRRTND